MIFFIDEVQRNNISYEKLINLIANKRSIKRYIKSTDTFEIYLELTAALFYGKDVELLDKDFSDIELQSFGLDTKNLHYEYLLTEKCPQIVTVDLLLRKIINNADKVKIGIYTSGTTGKPKKFIHSVHSLLRNIKVSDVHSNDIWGLAYNPTHFAGVQVFLQALMNKNPIINIFDSNRELANEILDKYECTNISATPTYYRNFIFSDMKPNNKIKGVTFGGERVNSEIIALAGKKFPNAKIRNVYASTEIGSLLSGNGEYFSVPKHLKSKIMISSDRHLLIHRSLINFIDMKQEWYDTNDIVELKENNTFKILSRDSDFINVGGYKVNPVEVEEVIASLPEVMDVVVYGRDNKVTGKIVAADIRLNYGYTEANMKKRLYQELKTKLQPFKIPRIIRIVDEIRENRSGKKVRI